MSIIGKVARKDPKTRILNLCIHLLLILGSITMIYPFALMLSSSIKSAVDSTRMELIPETCAAAMEGKQLQPLIVEKYRYLTS